MIYYRRIPYILAALLGCLIAARARADQCLHADDVARGQAQWSPCGEDRLRPTGQGSANMLPKPITTQNIPLVGTTSISISAPPPGLCESKTFKMQPTGELVCEQNTWHLLTQTYGGTMQLVKHLSKHECEFMRARALGEPATPAEEKEAAKAQEDYQKCLKARAPITGIYCIIPAARITGVSAGDIKTAECFK